MADNSSVTVLGDINAKDDSYETFWMPLLMASIAGGSTCLGAAVVFCQGRNSKQQRDSGAPLVSEGQLSFSLSLAGSVMLTVSVISIGPECLSVNAISPSTADTWISIYSMTFVHRLAAFALGCILYMLLSCMAFPDADVILGFDQEQQQQQKEQPPLLTTCPSDASSRSNSPVAWDKNDDTGAFVSDAGIGVSVFDMEKGGPNDVDNLQETLLQLPPKPTPTRPHSARRAAVARQRRLLRNSPSACNQSDDDITAATDASSCDDYAESEYYDKTDPTSTMPPLWMSWTGMRRMMQSFFCCCCSSSGSGKGSSLDSTVSPVPQLTLEQRRAWRVAMLLFVSLLCHNFPEGLAVAASALESPKLGMTVTIGIMIHNIPEGIAIAVPCLAARPHQPCLAFWLASLSGLAEPLGALLSLSILRPLTAATAAAAAAVTAAEQGNANGTGSGSVSSVHNMFLPDGWLALMFTMENILAFVAGIMITVALMDLFPEAWRHSQQSKIFFISGTLAGITVMVATEWYLP